MVLVRECPRSLKYCLIQRRQASQQAQFIPKIHEFWDQILGTQNFLSWWWIWIIQFGSQKWVIFHLQCIFWRWKYAGRYFPGAVNTCTVQSKCTPNVQIQEIQRDPKFITRWLWVSQEEMCCLEHRPACFLHWTLPRATEKSLENMSTITVIATSLQGVIHNQRSPGMMLLAKGSSHCSDGKKT